MQKIFLSIGLSAVFGLSVAMAGLGGEVASTNGITNKYEQEYNKYNSLAMEAWAKMPIKIKSAVLVEKEATGYGMYIQRESNKYLSGENILIYVEPIGFGHKDLGGFYRIDMESDLIVKNEKGDILGNLKAFGKFKFNSKDKNREIYLSLTISLGKASAGKYFLTIPLKDNIKNQTTEFTIPIEVVK